MPREAKSSRPRLTDVRIRERLPRTWHAFFSRWGRLTSIQRAAIPLVLERKPLLITAPTAAGKTEAVMAPLCEYTVSERWSMGSVLYVTPTRALVNDLFHRLQPIISTLGLSIGRRTGDFHEADATRWPHILLTTPESLDSMLCRAPEKILETRALILDELHLIDGSMRGDQLRGLILRLSWLLGDRYQTLLRYALSATIADPTAIGRRYLGNEFITVRAPHKRVIQPLGLFVYTSDEDAVRQVLEIMESHRYKKVLLFSNAKVHAERFATLLKKDWGRPQCVFVHHGRLSRTMRLDVENAFYSSPVGICIATTTLEVGVDIGGIDAVGLLGMPHTYSSFLQRIGRGRRRDQRIPMFAFYRDELEHVILETYLDLANTTYIPEQPYEPLPASIAQQTLSYILQKRRIGTSKEALIRLWSEIVDTNVGNIEKILGPFLQRLCEKNWLKFKHSLFYPGDRLFHAFEKGWIHSTIEDAPGSVQVVDEQNKLLAELTVDTVIPPGEIIAIGGRVYRVVKIKDRTLYVKTTSTQVIPDTAPFPITPAVYWPYTIGRLVLERLVPDLPENVIPVTCQGVEWKVFHGFGYVHAVVWSQALAETLGWRVLQCDSIQTTFETTNVWPPSWKPSPAGVRRFIETRHGILEYWFGRNRYYYMLPAVGRIHHLLHALRWASFMDHLATLEFKILR